MQFFTPTDFMANIFLGAFSKILDKFSKIHLSACVWNKLTGFYMMATLVVVATPIYRRKYLLSQYATPSETKLSNGQLSSTLRQYLNILYYTLCDPYHLKKSLWLLTTKVIYGLNS